MQRKLIIKLLEKGAKMFTGTHDFSTFRASTCVSNSPIKKMDFVKIKNSGDNSEYSSNLSHFYKSSKVNGRLFRASIKQ